MRELGDALPLAQVEGCEDKIWKASALMPIGRITDTGDVDHCSVSGPTQLRMMNRRSDVIEIARLTGLGFLPARGLDLDNPQHGALKLNTAAGLLKETHITYPLKLVHGVEAWCVGDADQIEELLKHVEFLGAKRRLGHGKVRRILVIDDPKAEQLWALRPLPSDAVPASAALACQDRVRVRIPSRAPYWEAQNAIDQLVPTSVFW